MSPSKQSKPKKTVRRKAAQKGTRKPLTEEQKRKRAQDRKKAKEKQARTVKAQAAFLQAFRLHGNVVLACDSAQIGRRTFYNWREEDEAFVEALKDARQDAADYIDAEIYRRGHQGVEKPVIWKGQLAYVEVEDPNTKEKKEVPLTITEYSDALLQFYAKGLMPEKYRETKDVRLTGRGGGPVKIGVVDEHRALVESIAKNPAAQAAAHSLVEAMLDAAADE